MYGCGHCKTFYNNKTNLCMVVDIVKHFIITRPSMYGCGHCKTFYNNKTNLCMVVDIVKHFIITRPIYVWLWTL